MLKCRIFCWAAIICSALTIASGEQTKPARFGLIDMEAVSVDPQIQAERNKVPVRQLYEEMFTKGRYELIDQAFAPGCPVHFGARSLRLEGAVAEGKGWRSAAPDLVMSIDQISVNGNMVTAVWTAKGTHTGHGHGLKPTGRRFLMHGRSQFKVVNGKIVEAWNEEYRTELYRQLGISKVAAFMFETADGIRDAISDLLPDSLYSLLH
jgi:predicted ester cyclase